MKPKDYVQRQESTGRVGMRLNVDLLMYDCPIVGQSFAAPADTFHLRIVRLIADHPYSSLDSLDSTPL